MPNYLNSTTQNVNWFLKLHQNHELEMSPPFQRKPVWVTKQKSFLIDTILNGFPIPEIYMQETIDDEGNAKYIVVDGQQRIRAVLDFLEARFTLDPKDSPEFADMGFQDLTTKQKKEFFSYKFVVRNLPDLPENDIREIFKRINTNVLALNAQELRQAIYWGPFIATMNSLANSQFWTSFNLFTANDIRRMLDIEYISELAVASLYGYQNKKSTLDYYYQLHEESFEEQNNVEELFEIVLSEIDKILPDLRSTRWKKKSDFYTLFLVFANHYEALPLAKEERTKARDLLIGFGEKVDEVGRTKGRLKSTKAIANIVKYNNAVAKAASDLGSRKTRAEAVEALLKGVWE